MAPPAVGWALLVYQSSVKIIPTVEGPSSSVTLSLLYLSCFGSEYFFITATEMKPEQEPLKVSGFLSHQTQRNLFKESEKVCVLRRPKYTRLYFLVPHCEAQGPVTFSFHLSRGGLSLPLGGVRTQPHLGLLLLDSKYVPLGLLSSCGDSSGHIGLTPWPPYHPPSVLLKSSAGTGAQ